MRADKQKVVDEVWDDERIRSFLDKGPMGNENHDFLPEMGDQEGPQEGPSWGNASWLETVADSAADLTSALDPTTLKAEVKEASKKAGKPVDDKALEYASDLSNKAMTLVRLYRVRGHMAADLDPLEAGAGRALLRFMAN